MRIRGSIEMATAEEIAKTFKVLSDETRLSILRLLLDGECSVCEVIQKLEISQTSASRNLSMLSEAGFLKLKRDGRWSRYSIADEPTRDHIKSLISLVGETLSSPTVAQKAKEKNPEPKEDNLGW